MIHAESETVAVLITAANADEARRIAEMLVNSRLSACVQILPEMESVYRWKERIERAGEVLLIAKSTRAKFAQLESQVRNLHSYEIPEILALPIVEGSAAYLEWLTESIEQ